MKILRAITYVSVAALFVATSTTAQAQLEVDSRLDSYQKVSGVSGNLNSIGSDTLNNLMTFWAEGFQKHYPNVRVQIEGKGSSTAPPALISGTSQIGPMSRPMKSKEIDAFEKKFGYKPTAIGVALDALAVYVNKDNPVKSLSIEQIDAIFSSTQSCGAAGSIDTWDQAGVSEWAGKPISMYGRNSASGTYGYFKNHALCKGDYKGRVKEQPGSAAVIEGISNDRYAVGYSGMGYLTAGVKLVDLIPKGQSKPQAASPDNVYAGTYPLSRYLYLYINKAPGQDFDPLVAEFLKYVMSFEGQTVVLKDGFIPLAREITEAEIEKLF